MQHTVSKSTYFTIAALLAVLLIATVGVARIDLGIWNVPVALVIAAAKAVLIVFYFMHVRYSTPLVRLFAGSGFFWLLILFTFLAADVLHRLPASH